MRRAQAARLAEAPAEAGSGSERSGELDGLDGGSGEASSKINSKTSAGDVAGEFFLAGVAAGLAVSFAAGQILESLLYEVAHWDPRILTSVPVVALSIALVSSLLPARRASQVDPMNVLRAE